MKKRLCTITCASGLLLAAGAQTYSIDWYKIAAGGGTSTGGVYSVSGTAGQLDAGEPMTGGNFSVTGGFWSIDAAQTSGAPRLTVVRRGSQTVVFWDSSVTGWTLQTNVSLDLSTWGDYQGSIINNSVSNSPPPMNLFYRLKQ